MDPSEALSSVTRHSRNTGTHSYKAQPVQLGFVVVVVAAAVLAAVVVVV